MHTVQNPTTIAVIILGAGLVLMSAGFAARRTTAGITLMAIGIVTVLITIGYYITETVQSL